MPSLHMHRNDALLDKAIATSAGRPEAGSVTHQLFACIRRIEAPPADLQISDSAAEIDLVLRVEPAI